MKSGGETDRGRGWSTCHSARGDACGAIPTAGGNAATASGATFAATAATTGAQHVNAGEVSPW